MLSIHGVHEWNVVPGLMDTGGQNVFVNQFSDALVKMGYRITIVNRGGYKHPRTGSFQAGLNYIDKFQRILYLEDGLAKFVRKEDMGDRFGHLVKALKSFMSSDGSPVDLLISHYWDAGALGCMLKKEMGIDSKHIWVPHSLGSVKKRNMPPQARESLRIPDRIENEGKTLENIDFVAATSNIIKEAAKMDYGYKGRFLWLPPCVDQDRYYPQNVLNDDPVWNYLSDLSKLEINDIQERRIITEISRTDKTKQKDVLIKSFAQVLKKHPKSLLIITIDDANHALAEELRGLIAEYNITDSTGVVGSIWEMLPKIYAITDIYCSPSIMEGFGMSVQEAAATKVPVISSDLIPFVTEYLRGTKSQRITTNAGKEIWIGDGAIIVPAGDIDGFSYAMDLLLSDDKLRIKMGENAYKTVISYFTWDQIVKDFIRELNY